MPGMPDRLRVSVYAQNYYSVSRVRVKKSGVKC